MNTPRRIILTRTREQCRPWRHALEAAGCDVLEMPLLRFALLPVPSDLDPASFDWILFTSPQGVRAFCDAGLPTGDARLGVLGDGTAAALRACGREDDLGARERDGAGLARVFTSKVEAPASVLLPGPERRLTEPRATLEAAGFAVTELPLYRTDAVPPSELPERPWQDGDLVFFASPTAVRAFAAAWGPAVPCIAIGETSARAASDAGFSVTTAASPDLQAMVLAAGLDRVLEPTPEPRESES